MDSNGLTVSTIRAHDKYHRIGACQHLGAIAIVICAVALTGAADSKADSPRESFAVENQAAMQQMMGAMSIKPSGDVDRYFADLMIPHHRGAIEMAQSELRYGHNEQLRRIAQEIIVDQQQEITAMNLAFDFPRCSSSPSQVTQLPHNAMSRVSVLTSDQL